MGGVLSFLRRPGAWFALGWLALLAGPFGFAGDGGLHVALRIVGAVGCLTASAALGVWTRSAAIASWVGFATGGLMGLVATSVYLAAHPSFLSAFDGFNGMGYSFGFAILNAIAGGLAVLFVDTVDDEARHSDEESLPSSVTR